MIIPVSELHIPELQLYSSQSETKLMHFYEPEPGLFVAETANVILRALKAGYKAESMLIEERYLKPQAAGVQDDVREAVAEILEQVGDIPIYASKVENLNDISGFKQTRGILCCMRRSRLPKLSEVIKDAKRIAILEDVENPTNVGAIFRSAAGLGFDAVILTYGSSDPLYRRSARVSMGSVFMLPWTFAGDKYTNWLDREMKEIKAAGFKTVSMALSDRAISLDSPILKEQEKLAVLFGNEEFGLSDRAIEESDFLVTIPMMHGVDSLNVAAASAVTFWELRNK